MFSLFMPKEKELEEIIAAYDALVLGIESKAKTNFEGRAYGGIIRAGKGEVVESITKMLVKIVWEKLRGEPSRIMINRTPFLLPIKSEYLNKLERNIREEIKKNIENYVYHYTPDVLISVDGKPVLEIECKAYTENAMLKRILVDATLVKSQYPEMRFALLQLESQLGGDYSELTNKTIGSPSTHTLLSYFDIDLKIITLLKGERKVDKPIHKKEFFKPLTKPALELAIREFEDILRKYV